GATAARSWPWYAGAAAATWLGAGTKEVMAVCPLVLLLFDRCFLAATWRDVFRRRWALHLAVGLAAVWLVFTVRGTFVAAGATANAGFGYQGVSSWEYLRSQPAVLLHYLRLAFWPDTLVLDYGWPVEHSAWRIYGWGAVIVALLGLSLLALARRPRLGFLGISFFLVLAPTSSILPIADIAFEHRMYLPLAAVVTLAVLAAWQLIERLRLNEQRQRLLGGGVLTLVVLALAARTIARNGDYCQPDRLWAKNIAAAPHHGRPYRLLAFHLRKAGRVDEAKAALEQSLAREPNDYKTWVEYGSLFFGERDYDRALVSFQQAIGVQPRCALALGNIGRIEMFRGNFSVALAASRSAAAADPNDPALRKQVAWLLATAPDAALRDGQEALRLIDSIRQNPRKTDIQWHEVRAAALAELGRFAEAVVAIRRAALSAESIRSPRIAELKAQQSSYQDGRAWRLAPRLPQLVQGEARP
ncbi:MAG TPA: tetratricopeptide repeat protein, partial [Pirellulaceae bacterium]|nr:tetratricopeptide repeat protein [Pirellulaceae bacterium]